MHMNNVFHIVHGDGEFVNVIKVYSKTSSCKSILLTNLQGADAFLLLHAPTYCQWNTMTLVENTFRAKMYFEWML